MIKHLVGRSPFYSLIAWLLVTDLIVKQPLVPLVTNLKHTPTSFHTQLISQLNALRSGITVAADEQNQLKFEYCSEKYGNRTFIPENRMFDQYPAHVISLPGAGNSWLRLLIEYATGYYTGSVDTADFEYLAPGGFEGERACGIRMSAIRAQTHHMDFLKKYKLRFRFKHWIDKCKRGMVREIKRIIVLVRNPYDTVWAYYQQLYSLRHRDYITTDQFDAKAWQFFSSYIAKYFNSDYFRILLPAIEAYGPDNVVVLRYEDLMDPATAASTLKSVTDFLALGRTKISDTEYSPAPPVPQEKLECAFLLADQPFVHRRTDDPNRVTSYTAYFSTYGLEGGRTWSMSPGSTAAAAAYQEHLQKTQRSLLCSLRTHFVDMAQTFNYTLAPNGYSADPKLCETVKRDAF